MRVVCAYADRIELTNLPSLRVKNPEAWNIHDRWHRHMHCLARSTRTDQGQGHKKHQCNSTAHHCADNGRGDTGLQRSKTEPRAVVAPQEVAQGNQGAPGQTPGQAELLKMVRSRALDTKPSRIPLNGFAIELLSRKSSSCPESRLRSYRRRL